MDPNAAGQCVFDAPRRLARVVVVDSLVSLAMHLALGVVLVGQLGLADAPGPRCRPRRQLGLAVDFWPSVSSSASCGLRCTWPSVSSSAS